MVFVSASVLVEKAIAGEVVSFPTDTVPALAVKPDNAQRIFHAKQRPPTKPLILMAAHRRDLWPYLQDLPEKETIWSAIAQQYWPGALTLVLPASHRLPPAINPQNTGTVGLRIPQQAIALEILEQTGVLATTSANLSGEPPLEWMTQIDQAFPQVSVLQCHPQERQGKIGNGRPSTVVAWQDHSWQILRQGHVPFHPPS